MTPSLLRIPSVLEEVAAACAFVADQAQAAGLDATACHHCYLATDEACTNIVEHGYGQSCPEGFIELICAVEGDQFIITIIDDSPAFDPLGVPDPDVKAPLAQREPGGWGIFFIKKLMDRVDYIHDGASNRLMMSKGISTHHNGGEPPAEARLQPIRLQELRPKTVLIAPSGKLDSVQSRELAVVFGQVFADGNRWLLLDLAEVDYISSAGFKTLVSAWQRARAAKGDLILVTLTGRVREVLEMIGLNLVFTIADSPEHALARLKK